MDLQDILQVAKKAMPQEEGTATLEGLHAPVEVDWDEWGIPHVYAESLEDAACAQGYLHARYRLFQMELYRRKFFGRLAEVLGEGMLPSDKFARQLGIHRLVQRRAAYLREHPGSEITRVLEAYRRGVNAGIARARENPPLEFAALGYTPEEWQLEHTLVVVEIMDWQESLNLDLEVLRAALVEKLGEETADKIFPLDEGAVLENTRGSNAWAIAPSKSATGGVIVANDPHLHFTLPMIWFMAHLHCPELNAIGVTLPGAPGIVIGHNEHVAWGITNVEADVQDLFRLEVNPGNPRQYKYEGAWVDFEVIPEPIAVKGRAEPEPFEVLRSTFGPVLEYFDRAGHEFEIPLDGTYALRWSGQDALPDVTAVEFLRLNRARDWQAFRESLDETTMTAHNFIYGDVGGNIGHQHAGALALRKKGNGARPAPGTSAAYAWEGIASFDQMAHWENPECGYLFTANYNPDKAPGPGHVLIAEDQMGLYRYLRLRELLEAHETVSLADCRAFQQDQVSIEARDNLPLLLDAVEPVEAGDDPPVEFSELMEILKAWDYSLDRKSRAGGFYKVWYHETLRLVLIPVIGKELYEMFTAKPPFSLRRVLAFHKEAKGEDAVHTAVMRAFQAAVAYLKEAVSEKPSRWSWGNVHKVTLVHPFAAAEPAAKVLNIGPFKVGGDEHCLNNGSYDPDAGYAFIAGPSYRQVLDLTDWDNSRCAMPGGQAGLPFHPHYNDAMKLWARGRYHPLLFTRDGLVGHLEHRLHLTPP